MPQWVCSAERNGGMGRLWKSGCQQYFPFDMGTFPAAGHYPPFVRDIQISRSVCSVRSWAFRFVLLLDFHLLILGTDGHLAVAGNGLVWMLPSVFQPTNFPTQIRIWFFFKYIDHDDPSKPLHRLTNGPEPSKTIASDGRKIKKKHWKTIDGNGQTVKKHSMVMVSSKTIGNLQWSLQNHWNLQLLQE